MGVSIKSPRSVLINYNESVPTLVTWESLETNQVAYELQYRLRKDDDWSTCGKVYSTNQFCSLDQIYTITNVDFYELYYRVIIYYDGPNYVDIDNQQYEGHISGTIISDAYYVIFVHSISALMYLQKEDSLPPLIFNVYKNISKEAEEMSDITELKISVSENETLIAPLVPETSLLKSDLKVAIDETNVKSVATAEPNFPDTGFYSYGYIDQYVQGYTEIYNYSYYPVYRTDAYYQDTPVYEYAPVYSYETVYNTRYDYMQYYDVTTYYYLAYYYYPTYDYYPYTDYYDTTEYAGYTYTAYRGYSYVYYYTRTGYQLRNQGYVDTGTYTYSYYFYAIGGYYYRRITGNYYGSVAYYVKKYGSREGTYQMPHTIYYYTTYTYTASGTKSDTYAYNASGVYEYRQSHPYTNYARYISGYRDAPMYVLDYYTIYSYSSEYSAMYMQYTYYAIDHYYDYVSDYRSYLDHYYGRFIDYYNYVHYNVEYEYPTGTYYMIRYSYNYRIN